MKAYVFPGQGAQFPGMAQDIYDSSSKAQERFAEAKEILGFDIKEIMFNGSDEDLKQTKVTQPAIFSSFRFIGRRVREFFYARYDRWS